MIGRTLGPYLVLERLGAGGMGEVFLAEDSRLRRKVAIKVLPPAFASDPERLARFEQEARAAAALDHPHIAAVHDVGVEPSSDGTGAIQYMVQEYLEGRTLREALAGGALPVRKAMALGIEVAEALRAAHRVGIAHRDLKPDSVFVTREGHAKILDKPKQRSRKLGALFIGSEAWECRRGSAPRTTRPDRRATAQAGAAS